MRMMNELKPLHLYSSNQKVYVPIDEKDKRKNSAILLLTPNIRESIRLTKLPYLHNPGLFNSFFIDRNMFTYINGSSNTEFYAEDEEAVSEAMISYAANSIKFKFDDHTSAMDEKYIREVYNKDTVKYYAKLLGIPKTPDKLSIVVHPNLSNLKKDAPSYIKNNKDYYSYFHKNTIHVLSKMVYDPESMRGYYNTYLLSELLYAIMISYNEDLLYLPTMAIAYSVAGLEGYMEKEKSNIISGDEAVSLIHAMTLMIQKHGYKPVTEYIRKADINIFTKYTIKTMVRQLNKSLFESTLSYYERQRLLPSDFAIPDKRAYPIHDEDHVLAAIRLFNNCDPDDEEELAKAIIKRIKRYGMTNVKVGPNNRFRKYFNRAFKKNENAIITESGYMALDNTNYYDSNYITENNPRHEYEELKNIKLSYGDCGEVFTNKDNELVAYYMTHKNDNGDIYITSIYAKPGYENAYSFLINRAVGIQDAEYANCNKNNEALLKEYRKFGFKQYSDTEDIIILGLNNSSNIGTRNDVQKVCASLPNDELTRITFYDTYHDDSKFVIKRIVAKMEDGTPAGFLDVYQFPSCPDIAQIVIAVDSNYRNMGVADKMVNAMYNEKLPEKYGFHTWYWTAHDDNIASQNLAIKHGFTYTGNHDRYGRMIFLNDVDDNGVNLAMKIPFSEARNNPIINKDSIITENTAMFFEADSKEYDTKIRQYLYSERIKNNKEVLLRYDEVKQNNPSIKKTYLKLDMYKNNNIFVDLSYYNEVFLKNNLYKLDKGANLYFELVNRLLNSGEVADKYRIKTIFIPVDKDIWPFVEGSDQYDYKVNLNPISVIMRLVRSNPGMLRDAWRDKNIVFVGSRGYFTVDFSNFTTSELPRFKNNLKKLYDISEVIKDDYDIDPVNDDINNTSDDESHNANTPKANAALVIDKIEQLSGNIKIDDISGISTLNNENIDTKFMAVPHLEIRSGNIAINKENLNKDNAIVIVSIDPDGPEGFTRFSKTQLADIGNSIKTYCIP